MVQEGLPNGGVECRWAKHKSQFWANRWLSIDCCQRANRLGVNNNNNNGFV